MKFNQISSFAILFLLIGCNLLATPSEIKLAPVPTFTPTKIRTPFPTVTILPSQTATLAPDQFDWFMISPDGTKKIRAKDGVVFEILDIASNKVLWSFFYDRAKFSKSEIYLSGAGYGIHHWSKDGKYIYIYASQGWDGGYKYFGNAFGAHESLARFDLETGIMTEILPERFGVGYTFGFSPDEKSIVYADQRETPIILRWKDLFANDEKSLLTFDNMVLDVGDFVWFPNMDKLVFQTMGPDGNDFLLLNLINLDVDIIIHEFKEPIDFVEWENQNKLVYKNWKGEAWLIDLDTKTLNAIGIATPNP